MPDKASLVVVMWKKEQFSSKIILCIYIYPNFTKKINDISADHKCEYCSAHFYGMMLKQHLWAYAFTEVPYQHFLDISKDDIGFIFKKNSNTKAILWKKIPQADAECIDFYQNPKFRFFYFLFSFVLWYRIFFFSKSTNDDRSDNITSFLSGKMLLVYYPCQDIDF